MAQDMAAPSNAHLVVVMNLWMMVRVVAHQMNGLKLKNRWSTN